ncbi:Os02g0786400 [Oryza sativa Japonica Group]|uniref:Os02g0786400 protein n=1 Tax=Oryza sativa subsp. japonica TaxID=39947 RepID=A0A0P0VQE6_ORYSJ|nr:hypothetical protein EE612_014119 [Oryza sativa]BAS81274.1 Os02g0786400 [Oryza sativa Japonica Group]
MHPLTAAAKHAITIPPPPPPAAAASYTSSPSSGTSDPSVLDLSSAEIDDDGDGDDDRAEQQEIKNSKELVMGRAPCCDKASVKKGPWSPEEDAKLKAYIEENGTGGNWIALPQKIGLKRCGKSCRLRWLNYLRPNIKHGDFTEEEEHIICSLYISIGSRWSIIAAQLPGRTDNDIKNYWNTKLKKKLLGKRAPSRRARANQDHCGLAGSAAAAMCGGVGTAAAAAPPHQALSSSALERIQLHMRLQGLYNSAFGCTTTSSNGGGVGVAPPQWPKLEALLPSRPLPAVQPTDASLASGFLDAHNAARRQVGVPPLRWDERLASYAARYAAARSGAGGGCALVHSHGPYGENLFHGSGVGWAPADVVAAWVSRERALYDAASNSCRGGDAAACGHYTQVVWRRTTAVGCALATCAGGRGTYGVCSYNPPGNYVGVRPY